MILTAIPVTNMERLYFENIATFLFAGISCSPRKIVADLTNCLPPPCKAVTLHYSRPLSRGSKRSSVVIRAEALCGFEIRSYITWGLTNCLPPSRLTSLNIGCTRHSQASLTLLSFARYFGITQTSLVLLSLLRRLQIPVNQKNKGFERV